MIKKLKPSFDDYELEPSPQVWMKIESRLDDVPEKRRGWLYLSIAAGALTALVVFITLLYDVRIDVKPKQHGSAGFTDKNLTQKNESRINSLQEQSSAIGKESEGAAVDHKTGSGLKREADNRQAAVNSQQPTNSKRKFTHLNEQTLLSSPEKNTKRAQLNTEGEHLLIANDLRASTEKMEPIDPFTFSPGQDIRVSTAYADQSDLQVPNKSSLSRWEIALGAAYEYNYRIINFATAKMSIPESEKNYFKNENGIHSIAFSASVSYSLSTHISVVSGISYLSAGQERSQSEVTQKDTGAAAVSNSVYSISTSTGNVVGSDQQLYEAYSAHHDSVSVSVIANPGNPSAGNPVLLDFKFRQQFYFISVPVLIRYQPAEHRFTPYIGLGFSIGYLVKEKVLLNNEKLDYHYSENLNRFLFSGEVQAGIKFKVSKHFSVSGQPSLRYGLNSISSNEVKWIPYAWGIGAGLNYRF